MEAAKQVICNAETQRASAKPGPRQRRASAVEQRITQAVAGQLEAIPRAPASVGQRGPEATPEPVRFSCPVIYLFCRALNLMQSFWQDRALRAKLMRARSDEGHNLFSELVSNAVFAMASAVSNSVKSNDRALYLHYSQSEKGLGSSTGQGTAKAQLSYLATARNCLAYPELRAIPQAHRRELEAIFDAMEEQAKAPSQAEGYNSIFAYYTSPRSYQEVLEFTQAAFFLAKAILNFEEFRGREWADDELANAFRIGLEDLSEQIGGLIAPLQASLSMQELSYQELSVLRGSLVDAHESCARTTAHLTQRLIQSAMTQSLDSPIKQEVANLQLALLSTSLRTVNFLVVESMRQSDELYFSYLTQNSVLTPSEVFEQAETFLRTFKILESLTESQDVTGSPGPFRILHSSAVVLAKQLRSISGTDDVATALRLHLLCCNGMLAFERLGETSERSVIKKGPDQEESLYYLAIARMLWNTMAWTLVPGLTRLRESIKEVQPEPETSKTGISAANRRKARRRRKRKEKIVDAPPSPAVQVEGPKAEPSLTQVTQVPSAEVKEVSTSTDTGQSAPAIPSLRDFVLSLSKLDPGNLDGSIDREERVLIRQGAKRSLKRLSRQLYLLLRSQEGKESMKLDEALLSLDLSRRLLESALDALVAGYPLAAADRHVMLARGDRKQPMVWGHDLRIPLNVLLEASYEVPSSLIVTLNTHKKLIHRLAHANQQLHYSSRTEVNSTDEGQKRLRNFLNRMRTSAQEGEMAAASQELLRHYVAPTLACVHSLLAEDRSGFTMKESAMQVDSKWLEGELLRAADWISPTRALSAASHDQSLFTHALSEELEASSSVLKRIEDTGDALLALQRSVHVLSLLRREPVFALEQAEGGLRERRRNQILNDLNLHLERLLAALTGSPNELLPMRTMYATHNAVRALRDAHIAALLHQPWEVEGVHIVDLEGPEPGLSLGYSSNIGFLNRYLYSGAKDLFGEHFPLLGPEMSWVSGAHRTFNATFLKSSSLPERSQPFAAAVKMLRGDITALVAAEGLEEGWITRKAGRNVDPGAVQEHALARSRAFIVDYLYPTLEALQKLLYFGFPLNPTGKMFH